MDGKIAVFRGKQIRKIIHKDEWYFSIVDIIEALTDSDNPRNYWNMMKSREKKQSKVQLSTLCVQLKLTSSDGKSYKTDCVNTKNAFRIIQSIPSHKAEPFKQWLAKVGHERIQEIEDPELATRRTKALYKAKGYSDGWIEKRMRGIAIREDLTDEWDKRGVKEQNEYAILTAEISKAAFGLTPSQYKKLKGLNRENLRDHFNDLELIFSMLGEAATTEITQIKDAHGFTENQKAARKGGEVAGNARKELEEKTGKRVVSGGNYLPPKSGKKLGGK